MLDLVGSVGLSVTDWTVFMPHCWNLHFCSVLSTCLEQKVFETKEVHASVMRKDCDVLRHTHSNLNYKIAMVTHKKCVMFMFWVMLADFKRPCVSSVAWSVYHKTNNLGTTYSTGKGIFHIWKLISDFRYLESELMHCNRARLRPGIFFYNQYQYSSVLLLSLLCVPFMGQLCST